MDKEREALVERLRDDPVRAALIFCLWHHQGGSSRIGQAIRLQVGLGEHEHLSDDQLATAKAVQAALTAQQEPVAEPAGDTGNQEADKIINRLMSDDPDFDDCIEAAAFIRKLVVDHRGPDGFATWKDAAIAARIKRTAPPSGVRDADGVVVPMGSLLQRIMSRLTDMLDDDKFNEIDGMVRDAGYEPPILAAAKEPLPKGDE